MADRTASTPTGQTDETEPKPSAKTVAALLIVAVVSFLGILTETSLSVSFPDLSRELHVSLSTVQWLTSGYLLVISVIMVASSFLNSRFTARQLFRFGAIAFIVGSVLCIVAPSFPLLLFGRLLSAFAAGLNTPLMFNLVTELMPASQRGYWMGVVGLVVALAPGLGPTVGGLVADRLGWRTVFWIVAALMLVTLIAGWRLIGRYHPVTHPRFDWVRFLVISLALASFLIGFNRLSDGLSSPVFWAGMIVTAVLVALFVWLSRRSTRALFDVNVFRNPRFTLTLIAYLILQALNIGLSVTVPSYAQIVDGLSVLQAGLILLPGSLIPSLFNPWYGRQYDVHGPRPVLLSASVLILVGTLLFALFGPNLTFVTLLAFYLTLQLGFRAAFSNTLTYGISVTVPERHPDATAVMQAAQQYAGSIGTTVLTTIMALSQRQASGPRDPRYAALTATGATHAFWFTVLMAATVLVIYLVLLFKKNWKAPVPEPHEESEHLAGRR